MGPIQPAHMAVIWFALFTLCLAEATGAAGKTVVCYWQSWSRNMSSPHTYTADDIPVHLCTHVVYSYAKAGQPCNKYEGTFKRSANFTLSCATVLPKGRELQAVIRELVPYVDTFHVSPVAGSAGGISSNGTHASRNGSDTLHTSLSRAAIRDGLQYLFEAGLPYEKIVLEIPFLRVESSRG
ncbi:hypothetical protein MTO96_000955 [Rhipicephalus appendiculatus]